MKHSPQLARILQIFALGKAVTLANTPAGFDAFASADIARALAASGPERSATLVHVARDGARSRAFMDALAFAAPDIEALEFPAWDCQPYDRVSPNARSWRDG
jgi:transcription-repair coupling factor (superfamily II helicase)